MISRLSIDNYALIDKTDIEFGQRFVVITGETGAGKSIMLDALSLLMGSRADTKAVGNKERKTIVEALFRSPDPLLKKILEENNIEWDADELIVRREINPSGKSRNFVNDTPVNLGFLGLISSHLLDIHSQHSNALLNRPEEQLAIIDAFGETSSFQLQYLEVFKEYVALRNRIKKIKEARATGKENREFLLFRLEQLDKLKPKRGELEQLEREAEILGDADNIKTNLEEALTSLSGGNASALRQLQHATSLLEVVDFDLLDPSGNDEVKSRLDSLKIELRDICDTIEGYSDKINSDPELLEKVQSRIESLYEAMKRFKVKDEEELVTLHMKLKEELEGIDSDNVDVSEMERQLKERAKILKERADQLSEKRVEVASRFAETIEEAIRPLGLPNVKFKVEIEKGKMSAEGQDIVTFSCSFNKNHPLQPVAAIASGGEISRVMLGLKSIMAKRMKLPTVIFDEIDTGVSGEIAHKMGKMMKEMSADMQVISVTHLPQVAASGDTHLKVYKADDKEKTVSHVKVLSSEERVNEIAGMLSGTTINEAALENAKILLNSE
ncbi:MAG: DNA repair protein RecN [Muribaculaceae bacterium]|nr:DNA repair protein RecN [Muribaculaceae bacterium]